MTGRHRQVGRNLEPVLLAVLLALACVVPVAWALQAGPSAFAIEQVGWHPLGTGEVILLAFGSVAPAGVLGGIGGALVWSRRRTMAPVVALSIAWATGIVALPIVAASSDIPLRTGLACVDACRPLLTDADPLGGVGAYAETVLTWPLTFPIMVVPAVLLLLARRFRRPALWIVTWLALHAALHLFPIFSSSTLAIYGLLMIGVILWMAWLWARDAGILGLSGPARRWAVVVAPLAVIVGASWSLAAAGWVPAVPRSIAETVVGTAELHGFNPPDPSEWFPSIIVPRTPEGSGCLDPIVRPAGRIDLCWEGHRDNREVLPGGDIYHLRLLAALHSANPATWVSITISIPEDDRTLIEQVWPNGVVDGPCRGAAIEGMNFLTDGSLTNDVADDAVCGRTTSVRGPRWKSHHIIWTCTACGAGEPAGRQIALREIVGTAEGAIPTWTVSAEIGR
jgi:hypothetical protein